MDILADALETERKNSGREAEALRSQTDLFCLVHIGISKGASNCQRFLKREFRINLDIDFI